jgi:hypothetical protein
MNTALPELKVTHVTLTCTIIKMWFADHRWSAAVCQVVRGFPKAISKEKAKIASVWKVHWHMSVLKLPLTERRRMWPLHNVLSFRHYFRKCFKLVHRNSGYDNFNHRYNVSPIHLHTFWQWGTLRSLSTCAPIACEVVRDCRKFEKHWLTYYLGDSVYPHRWLSRALDHRDQVVCAPFPY